jgi:hypothetical protein
MRWRLIEGTTERTPIRSPLFVAVRSDSMSVEYPLKNVHARRLAFVGEISFEFRSTALGIMTSFDSCLPNHKPQPCLRLLPNSLQQVPVDYARTVLFIARALQSPSPSRFCDTAPACSSNTFRSNVDSVKFVSWAVRLIYATGKSIPAPCRSSSGRASECTHRVSPKSDISFTNLYPFAASRSLSACLGLSMVITLNR